MSTTTNDIVSEVRLLARAVTLQAEINDLDVLLESAEDMHQEIDLSNRKFAKWTQLQAIFAELRLVRTGSVA